LFSLITYSIPFLIVFSGAIHWVLQKFMPSMFCSPPKESSYRSKGDYFIDRKRTDTLKEPLYSSRSLGRDDHVTMAILEQELPSLKTEEASFFYINFAGTHFPYRVGKDYQRWNPTCENGFHPQHLNLTVNQYDNALLYFDAAFQKA
jgi:hypothetical protein